MNIFVCYKFCYTGRRSGGVGILIIVGPDCHPTIILSKNKKYLGNSFHV